VSAVDPWHVLGWALIFALVLSVVRSCRDPWWFVPERSFALNALAGVAYTLGYALGVVLMGAALVVVLAVLFAAAGWVFVLTADVMP
jgi:hypothetical protein